MLLPRALPGVVKRGYIDYAAIDSLFNWYNVSSGARPVLLDKFLTVFNVLMSGKNKPSAQRKQCSHPSVCAMCGKRCPDRVTVQ